MIFSSLQSKMNNMMGFITCVISNSYKGSVKTFVYQKFHSD